MNIFIMVFILTFPGTLNREWIVPGNQYASMEACLADIDAEAREFRALVPPSVVRLVGARAECVLSNKIYV